MNTRGTTLTTGGIHPTDIQNAMVEEDTSTPNQDRSNVTDKSSVIEALDKIYGQPLVTAMLNTIEEFDEKFNDSLVGPSRNGSRKEQDRPIGGRY